MTHRPFRYVMFCNQNLLEGERESLHEKDPLTTRKPRHSVIYVTQKRVTLKTCHLFKKFKDLCHALLRALRLVSHVKKIKTRSALVRPLTVSLYNYLMKHAF